VFLDWIGPKGDPKPDLDSQINDSVTQATVNVVAEPPAVAPSPI